MRPDELANLVERAIRDALSPVVARLTHVEGKAAAVETRLVGFESWRPVPGPAGPPGRDGTNGKDGKDGTNGTNGIDGKDGASLRYCGTWLKGGTYDKGDLVTWDGSMWHANGPIGLSVPGDGSKDWTLCVKRGRDSKGSEAK
jgi:hypothetical protein